MLEFYSYNNVDSLLGSDVWELYEKSFPAEEKRLPQEQAIAMSRHDYHALGIYDNDRIVGLLFFFELGGIMRPVDEDSNGPVSVSITEYVYIDHFALIPEFSESDTESEILKAFCGGRKVIMEAKPPLDVSDEKRLSFLAGSGFAVNEDYLYIHPGYTTGTNPYSRLLLTYPEAEDEEMLKELDKNIKLTLRAPDELHCE